MNKLTIAGHLGSDPEVRHTTGGLKVTTFNVAVNIRKQGKDETIWYRVTIWGDRFDKMVQYLKKGSAVIVSGDLYPSIWQDKTRGDQAPRLSLELTADSIQFSPFGRSATEKEGQTAGAAAQSGRQGYSQGSSFASNPVSGGNSGSFDNLDSYVEGYGATYGAAEHDESKDNLPF